MDVSPRGMGASVREWMGVSVGGSLSRGDLCGGAGVSVQRGDPLPPPVNRQVYKHYLPATLFAGGKIIQMESFIKGPSSSNIINIILQVVHSKFEDLVPKVMDEDDPELQRPDEDELAEVSLHYRFNLC